MPSTARSISASSITMTAFFPPSSREAFASLPAQFFPIILPIALEPVKDIIETSGWLVSASPASGPNPWIRLITPFGRPASSIILTKWTVVSGVFSSDFRTTVLPQSRAGNVFQHVIAIGKFHEVIIPITPMGYLFVIANRFLRPEWVVRPYHLRPSLPAKNAMSMPDCTSPIAPLTVLPFSRDMTSASSFLLAVIIRPASYSIFPRSGGGMFFHSLNEANAAATALPISSFPDRGKRPIISLILDGFLFSNVSPETALTHSLFI